MLAVKLWNSNLCPHVMNFIADTFNYTVDA